MKYVVPHHRHTNARTILRCSLAAVSLTTLTLLAGCANPIVTQNAQLAPADYASLSSIWHELPIEEKGDPSRISSGHPPTPADYRVVVYFNPSTLPPPARWCDTAVDTRPNTTATEDLRIAAALCHHGEVVTTAEGRVPLNTTTPEQREQDIAFVERLLLDELDPDPTHGLYGS